jgi:hypothetical protein
VRGNRIVYYIGKKTELCTVDRRERERGIQERRREEIFGEI